MDKTKQKTLFLSLKKQPFDVMVTGEKKEEFRKNKNWIRSRLFDNQIMKKNINI